MEWEDFRDKCRWRELNERWVSDTYKFHIDSIECGATKISCHKEVDCALWQLLSLINTPLKQDEDFENSDPELDNLLDDEDVVKKTYEAKIEFIESTTPYKSQTTRDIVEAEDISSAVALLEEELEGNYEIKSVREIKSDGVPDSITIPMTIDSSVGK